MAWPLFLPALISSSRGRHGGGVSQGEQDLAFTTGQSTASQARPTTLHQRVEHLERSEIEAALAKTHGNRTHAAEALGLSRQGLLKKMSRYGLN